MDALRILAVALIAAGGLGVAYGGPHGGADGEADREAHAGFNYTKQGHRADIGPPHLEVTEQQHVNVPLWASIGAVVGGVLLLSARPRKA